MGEKYDDAIPKMQSGFTELPCKVEDCFVPRNDGLKKRLYTDAQAKII
jgi:hypothetical protein